MRPAGFEIFEALALAIGEDHNSLGNHCLSTQAEVDGGGAGTGITDSGGGPVDLLADTDEGAGRDVERDPVVLIGDWVFEQDGRAVELGDDDVEIAIAVEVGYG